MKCSLCEGEIDGYSADLNRLVIDESHAVDICPGCIDKFVKWQGKRLAVLFPTKAMKRRFGGGVV
ncbi:MAG: hypothetical protein JW839_06155 [Candidatus Lokiarchaeota archaeon]|nr:hypothetical protein [Candidatus Lokiarchaeota archaeon]